MNNSERTALFISHANPEDNAFTIWLGAKLAAAGYDVWADVLKLRGGQDWQRRLEDALRNKSCKVLLVGTENGVQKQGVRNEIQIAHNIGKTIRDMEFIIPLRLTDFDAPFLIVHAQYIDFKRSWADGLAELLDTLDQTYRVPRSRGPSSETSDYWKHVHLRHTRSLTLRPEPLVSNWLSVDRLPEKIFFYDFRTSISPVAAKQKIRSLKWPVVPFWGGFLAFCPLNDLQKHFGPDLPLQVAADISTETFLDEGWLDQGILRSDAHNQFSSLIRQAMELTLSRRSLTSKLSHKYLMGAPEAVDPRQKRRSSYF